MASISIAYSLISASVPMMSLLELSPYDDFQ